MELKLYNTLTKTKEVFKPLDPKNVRLYVCGPTVYDYAHIGNARPAIVFDVLFRLLRHLYGPEHVTYVRNITDIDDKINARAAEIAAERKISVEEARADLTKRTYDQYQQDVAALGCLPLPEKHQPRATDHIAHMIAMIEALIGAGHAYVAQGHVLYDVTSKPDYGKLARKSVEEMMEGARVEVAPYKKGPMDFVLWKPSSAELPGWESPWGRGRPGWHIECSAMSKALLGETFDIHGGGIDLVFPHHENEIAQSEGAHHGHPLAKVWMHNGFLQVEGEKMSKSLGNFVTINELLTNWKRVGWPGESLRFAMMRSLYRHPIDWTYEGLDVSHKILWDWYGDLESNAVTATLVPPVVVSALSDDLNTPQMITELHTLKRKSDLGALLGALQFLGFSCSRSKLVRVTSVELKGMQATTAIGELKPVVTAFTQSEIQAQIDARNAARKARDFKEADRIRAELDAMGVQLKDSKDPATGEIVTRWEPKR
jgi:cysteinyl-tRNA synthetase